MKCSSLRSLDSNAGFVLATDVGLIESYPHGMFIIRRATSN
jgi:hypothetical protein